MSNPIVYRGNQRRGLSQLERFGLFGLIFLIMLFEALEAQEARQGNQLIAELIEEPCPLGEELPYPAWQGLESPSFEPRARIQIVGPDGEIHDRYDH